MTDPTPNTPGRKGEGRGSKGREGEGREGKGRGGEGRGGEGRGSEGDGPTTEGRPAFVLHDHRKPRPHFDLRLEEEGVLRSWALPRGLPTGSATNRLAVGVPDHDFAHLTYTDEHKFIADIGWWELEDRTDKRFVFVLHGRDGAKRYALIHTEHGTNGKNWLLHFVKDQPRP